MGNNSYNKYLLQHIAEKNKIGICINIYRKKSESDWTLSKEKFFEIKKSLGDRRNRLTIWGP